MIAPLTALASLAALAFLAAPTPLAAQAAGPSSPCADDPAYATLDFWVGAWDVRVGERSVGTNRIEKVLSGCAVMEHWEAAGGGRGKSLFYRVPSEDAWKQVWVTEKPASPGGVKEKTLHERTEAGGTVFRGEVMLPDGRRVLDQTRLEPLPDGSVRQVIEYSQDDGATWSTVFDALYVPQASRERAQPRD